MLLCAIITGLLATALHSHKIITPLPPQRIRGALDNTSNYFSRDDKEPPQLFHIPDKQQNSSLQLPTSIGKENIDYEDSVVLLLQYGEKAAKLKKSSFASESDSNNENIDSSTADSPSERNQHAFRRKIGFASVMALLAGISDTLCLQRFNCFATMMTGNTIILSLSLAESRWLDAMWRASFVGSYLVGAVCIQSIEVTSLKWIVPILASIFSIAEYLHMLPPERWQSHAVVPVLALGYGMIYTYAYQELDRNSANLVTGHIMMLGSEISDFILGIPVNVEQMAISSCVFVSLVMGCIVGRRFICTKTTSFPYFALLGISYAAVFTVYLS